MSVKTLKFYYPEYSGCLICVTTQTFMVMDQTDQTIVETQRFLSFQNGELPSSCMQNLSDSSLC